MAGAGTIAFPTGVVARTVDVPADASGDDVLSRLDLPPPRGTIVVNGSTAPLERDVRDRLAEVVVHGVAKLAAHDGLTVVTGGTDAGVFRLLGPPLARAAAPVVGVAPRGRVSWPGMRSRAGFTELEPLEPHHSHFVLVEGDEWGDETGVLLALAGALAERAAVVAVLCGGGFVSRTEVLGHVRAGRPVVVLAGSGRLADDITRARALDERSRAGDPQMAEIAGAPVVAVVPVGDGADAVAGVLRTSLRGR